MTNDGIFPLESFRNYGSVSTLPIKGLYRIKTNYFSTIVSYDGKDTGIEYYRTIASGTERYITLDQVNGAIGLGSGVTIMYAVLIIIY